METFAEPRESVANAQYARDRQLAMTALAPECIDAPIRDIILGFARLPHCFTLQSCYGHFVYAGQSDPGNLAALPAEDVGPVMYRIAYLALCIENSVRGIHLRKALKDISAIDPKYVQFGSPDWFWEQYPNSYALQVEPETFMFRDEAVIEHQEALHVQQIRDRFFEHLRKLVDTGLQAGEVS